MLTMDTTIPTTTTTTTTTTTEPTTEPAAPAYDGEQLGGFIFDVRADHLAQGDGLWVLSTCYDDLRDCMARVATLTASLKMQFFTLHIREEYLATGGASAAIDEPGYYPATTAEQTPALRAHMRRAFDRVRGMAPISTDESEA